MSICTPAQLVSWGWRIGFWFGGVLIFFGFFLRRGLPESELFLQAIEQRRLEKNPFTSLFTIANFPSLIIGIIFIGFHAVVILQNFTLMPGFLHQYTHTSMNTALSLNTASLVILSLLIPFMGLLSDHFGRHSIEGGSYHIRLSLAQTAHWFKNLGYVGQFSYCKNPARENISDYLEQVITPFGIVEHLKSVLQLSKTPPKTFLPAVPLGYHPAAWV